MGIPKLLNSTDDPVALAFNWGDSLTTCVLLGSSSLYDCGHAVYKVRVQLNIDDVSRFIRLYGRSFLSLAQDEPV